MLDAYEILELENRWKKYKSKQKKSSYKKYSIFVLILAVIGAGVSGFFAYTTHKENLAKQEIAKLNLQKEVEELKQRAREAKLKLEQQENNVSNATYEEPSQKEVEELKQRAREAKLKLEQQENNVSNATYEEPSQNLEIVEVQKAPAPKIPVKTKKNITTKEKPAPKKPVKTKKNITTKEKPAPKKPVKTKKNITTKEKPAPKLITQKEVEIEENLEFINQIPEVITVEEFASVNEPQITPAKQEIEQKKQDQKQKVIIEVGELNLSIASLKKRFESTNDVKYAIMLANEFYKQNDYQNAMKWAFIINNIDVNKAEGWIIFAKAKYKMGKKGDALKVLEALKQKQPSTNVDGLIVQIRTGTL
ncbi:hypothetical protein CIG11343_0888 [Campylobacter iguaniorum]|uniref:hypothetical protein n=1 Tax=Campylobacter iguaniorum TaxID=1244531 RepID=UPI0007C8AB09|nr:hypothetical protein [Campylobacter iguaniorum]ANE35915.1 hypothetical protein CIG11343_0888 [Campylobacter iguaniorum]